jgi:hypothetical protein
MTHSRAQQSTSARSRDIHASNTNSESAAPRRSMLTLLLVLADPGPAHAEGHVISWVLAVSHASSSRRCGTGAQALWRKRSVLKISNGHQGFKRKTILESLKPFQMPILSPTDDLTMLSKDQSEICNHFISPDAQFACHS